MEMRDSAKIAIGVVSGLIVVGALHMLVFKNRAADFEAAKAKFERARTEIQGVGGARDQKEIYAFHYESLMYDNEYWKWVRDLRLTTPAHFYPGFEDRAKQLADFENILTDLEKLRDDNVGPKLTFLGDRGWDLRNELPRQLQGTSVEDYIDRLIDLDGVIKNLVAGTNLYNEKVREYNQRLGTMGLDLARRDAIRQQWGELAALMHTINRVMIVEKALRNSNFYRRQEPAKAREQLYQLFRVEITSTGKLGIFGVFRQAEHLKQLLAYAEEAQIAEITDVKLWDARNIIESAAGAAPATGATGGPAGGPPNVGLDPRFSQPDDEGGNFLMPNSTPPPSAPAIAVSVPIEIGVIGTNPATMTFLDLVCRKRGLYEVDALNIASVPRSENLQRAVALVNCVARVKATGDVDLLLADLMLDASMNDNLNKRRSIALKAGAKELAEKDGVVVNGQLIPEPTPITTP